MKYRALLTTLTLFSSSLGLYSQGLELPSREEFSSSIWSSISSFESSRPPLPTSFLDLTNSEHLPKPGSQVEDNPHNFKNCHDSCMGWVVGYGLGSYVHEFPSSSPYNPIYLYHHGLRKKVGKLRVSKLKFKSALNVLEELEELPSMSGYVDPLVLPQESDLSINDFDSISISVKRIGRVNIVRDVKRVLYDFRMVVPAAFNIPGRFHLHQGIEEFSSNAITHDKEAIAQVSREENLMVWTSTPDVDGKIKHAMLIVGFHDEVGPNGSFLAMNSYGNDFGNDGYIWIDYDHFSSMGVDRVDAFDNPCCIAAYWIQRIDDIDDPIELEKVRPLVAKGEEGGWVRLMKNNSPNFNTPDDLEELTPGAKIRVVSKAAQEKGLLMRARIGEFESGSRTVTNGAPIVGWLNYGDEVEVVDIRKVYLDRLNRSEHWVLAKKVQ